MSFGLQDESQAMNCPGGILQFGLFRKGEKDMMTSTRVDMAGGEPKGPNMRQACKESFYHGPKS